MEKAFNAASKTGYKPSSPHQKLLETVILGSHLTFRYILTTALLAKATNPRANGLSLQAGAKLKGAFDARSLCHSVLVPFERKKLQGGLGASNEPFLNKPARTTHLDKDNAVRGGGDQQLLNLLCDNIPKINGKEALQALTDALFYVLQRAATAAEAAEKKIISSKGRIEVLKFALEFVKESMDGEACALTIGSLLQCQLCCKADKDYEVRVHPVNQSGASSREVSDIDVYHNKALVMACEVKDKVFSQDDVEHAVTKVVNAGFTALLFIFGPRASLSNSIRANATIAASARGVHLAFVSVVEFINTSIAGFGDWKEGDYYEFLVENSTSARTKDSTKARILNVAEQLGWLVEGAEAE